MPKMLAKPKKKTEVSKLKTSVALAITQDKKKRISKLNTKGMRSILGDSSETVLQLLEVGKNDSAVALIQKRLLQSLVDVLPYAEHGVRESKGAKGIYGLNALITSLRECVIDLQATKDRGALGSALIEKILRPTFLDIGMMLVQEAERSNSEVKALVSLEDYKEVRKIHSESLSRMASTIKSKYDEAKDGAIAFLQQ